MSDHDAIRNLLAEYCFGTDTGDTERWLATMTEDVVWDGGAYGRFEGRSACRDVHQSSGGATMLRHLTLNSMIRVDGDKAVAHSYVLLLQQGEALTPVACLFYDDQLQKEPDGWRIRQRVIHSSPGDVPVKL